MTECAHSRVLYIQKSDVTRQNQLHNSSEEWGKILTKQISKSMQKHENLSSMSIIRLRILDKCVTIHHPVSSAPG